MEGKITRVEGNNNLMEGKITCGGQNNLVEVQIRMKMDKFYTLLRISGKSEFYDAHTITRRVDPRSLEKRLSV